MPRKIAVAIIGMPRSGTTIITSFLNSLDGAIVVGEPHRMAMREAPDGFRWPTIIDTRFNQFHIRPEEDVLQQIERFAEFNYLNIYGFKEACMGVLDPIRLVLGYGSRIDIVIVTMRDPRKTYNSMFLLSPTGHPPPIYDFSDTFVNLVSATFAYQKFRPVILDHFRADPIRAIELATGWKLGGELNLKKYAGGGDPSAATTKRIIGVDRRAQYGGHELDIADEAYQEILNSFKY